MDDNFDVYGLDLSATALLSDSWSLSGTLSLVNDNVFETEKGEQVTLNAPKTKAALAPSVPWHRERPERASSGHASTIRSRCARACTTGRSALAATRGRCRTLRRILTRSSTSSSATACPFQGASLQLSVQNLLDEDYRSFPGVPTIGRMALLRLKYDF